MNAEIVSVGNELLDGSKQNTNALWLADQLLKIGVKTRWVSTVGDEIDSIQAAVSQSLARSNVVLVTGGLGPTHDDVTKSSLAELFGRRLVEDNSVRDHIIGLFAERGRRMPEVNLEQALVPEGAMILHNEIGTAPGFCIEHNNALCFVLPGVPLEMKRMTENHLIPNLKTRVDLKGKVVFHETVRTTGISESSLYERLSPLGDFEEHSHLAFLPHTFGVDLRICTEASDEETARRNLQTGISRVSGRINAYIYEIGGRTLEKVVADLLLRMKETVAVAESCTGGLLANLMTNISGSSDYFLGGLVAYDDSIKTTLLGVKKSTVKDHGAVSEETAQEMAIGVRSLMQADWGLATTGIAGPMGGSKEKPVGLIHIAIAGQDSFVTRKHLFHRERLINKSRFAYAALNLLRQALLGKNPQ